MTSLSSIASSMVKKLIEELNGLGPESQEMPVKFGEKHGPEGYLPIKTVRSGEEGGVGSCVVLGSVAKE